MSFFSALSLIFLSFVSALSQLYFNFASAFSHLCLNFYFLFLSQACLSFTLKLQIVLKFTQPCLSLVSPLTNLWMHVDLKYHSFFAAIHSIKIQRIMHNLVRFVILAPQLKMTSQFDKILLVKTSPFITLIKTSLFRLEIMVTQHDYSRKTGRLGGKFPHMFCLQAAPCFIYFSSHFSCIYVIKSSFYFPNLLAQSQKNTIWIILSYIFLDCYFLKIVEIFDYEYEANP